MCIYSSYLSQYVKKKRKEEEEEKEEEQGQEGEEEGEKRMMMKEKKKVVGSLTLVFQRLCAPCRRSGRDFLKTYS